MHNNLSGNTFHAFNNRGNEMYIFFMKVFSCLVLNKLLMSIVYDDQKGVTSLFEIRQSYNPVPLNLLSKNIWVSGTGIIRRSNFDTRVVFNNIFTSAAQTCRFCCETTVIKMRF